MHVCACVILTDVMFEGVTHKAINREMAERRRQRPVEFRGLSTHYVSGEDIRVCFRYPATSFRPNSDDKIKLYLRNSREKSIASASVGDVSKHRLCDGGLYRTGSVSIPTVAVNGSSQRSCILLYGSSKLRQVVGKSEPFIICQQKDFPSIQIRSMEDRVFVEKLRSHSPICSQASKQGTEDLSFSMVDSEWEELRGEEEEEEEEESDWSDVGDDQFSTQSDSSEGSDPGPVSQCGGQDDTPTPEYKDTESLSNEVLVVSLSDLPRDDDGTAVMLKNANKELRTKVRVLHDKLHCVSQERDGLLAVVEDAKAEVKQETSELKQKNQKLAKEKAELKSKSKQLLRENAVLTSHCERQLAQISQYDSELRAVSREKQQLQRKLHHTTKQCGPEQLQKQHKTSAVEPAASAGVSRPRKKKYCSRISQQRPVIDVYVRDPVTRGELADQQPNSELSAPYSVIGRSPAS